MPPALIAVTGATGAVGSRVLPRLAAAGVSPRLVVRDPSRLPPGHGGHVRLASDLGARDEMTAALQGVDTLLLIPAAESEHRVDVHRAAIDAASDAGVRRVVYVSFLGAAPDATFVLARDHWATEEHLRASGMAWTLLRMSLYLDFVPSMVLADGRLAGPAGEGRVAPILRDDVAAASAAVLLSDGHDGRTYELTGGEAFSLGEAAALMAARSGRPIRFVDETEDEAWSSRRPSGAPEWEVRGWVSSYLAIRDGSLSTVSDDFARLTGREPVGFDAFLREHPEALDHIHPDGPAPGA
jgi:uncharacterized protein YbjT (DUF2867 family)